MTFSIVDVIDMPLVAPIPTVRYPHELADLHRPLVERATALATAGDNSSAYTEAAGLIHLVETFWRSRIDRVTPGDFRDERMRESVNEAIRAIVAAIRHTDPERRRAWFNVANAWRDDVQITVSL